MLVVGADSSVVDLDPVTVRKLFLGLPVLINGSHPLHPVRNRSDQRSIQIFLQQIVAMSQSAYDRQILIGVNRQGWLRPVEITTRVRVLETLYSDPNAVTFMWLRDVEHESEDPGHTGVMDRLMNSLRVRLTSVVLVIHAALVPLAVPGRVGDRGGRLCGAVRQPGTLLQQTRRG